MAAKITQLRHHSRYRPDFAVLARNRVAAARAALGADRKEFARVLTSLVNRQVTEGLVASWEDSVTPPGDVVVAASSISPNTSTSLGIRSHKFISITANDQAVSRLCSESEFTSCTVDIEENCTLHVWPFGSAIVHLVEDIDFPDITSFAFWRYESYEENMQWAAKKIAELTGAPAESSYILSFYWVHSPIWSGRILETALKIICTPRILLERQEEIGTAERSLLAEDYDHEEIKNFGVQGVSSGYASWSGVVYHPFDTHRALQENEIVQVELQTQAIWSYCAKIADLAERGIDPTIIPGYGYKFLRSCQSRLLTPRPQETGAHRLMQDTIIQTSGLPQHFSNAIDILKDIGAP